jgi:hypothetical protein
MKKLYLIFRVVVCVCGMLSAGQAVAQCGAGYTQSQLNWDYLDFLVSTGSYSGFVSASDAQNQAFTMGTNRVRFIVANSNITISGENYSHTGDAGSFGTGADASFTTTTSGSRTITIVFDSVVTNLRFSLYDIDNGQKVGVQAWNPGNTAQSITMTKPGGGSVSLSGSPGTNPTGTGGGSNVVNTSSSGTVNIAIATAIDSLILTFSTQAGDFWISDLSACVTGSFPSAYRVVSRPFTGMPSYILTVVDSVFLLVDPATGKSKFLFNDPGNSNMNGMAYDPYHRILYYSYSLTSSPANTKSIYKYSVDNGTISTFVADVTAPPLNIPTYDPGVTSGSASFYNGSLYFGVEASNSSRTSGRENTVWKIDLDASQNPVRASQVYAVRVDSTFGGNDRLIHDWSDIGVTNNGMLYDFNGAGAGTSSLDSMYYHFDMMTGQRTDFDPTGPGNIGPKQTAIDWQENVYNMGGLPTKSTNSQTIGGFIVPYSYNGAVNNAQNRLITLWPGGTTPIGSWGDCSEAFRPLCDFGDAPASYDPNPLSPAVNEITGAILRIGTNVDKEWLTRGQTAAANSDNFDDGISTVPIFNNNHTIYGCQVNVFNNTGANATLIGWFDWNGNGVFNVGEASGVITVASSGLVQNKVLSWTGISSPIASGSSTYLRIRITSTANLMTTASPTGWFDNGETEDYRVLVSNTILPVNLISFDAKAISNSKVKLSWSATEDADFSGYEVQRNGNGSDWEYVGQVPASQGSGIKQYELMDNNPYKGTSRYRLRLIDLNNQSRYSEIRTVKITDQSVLVTVSPNPATDKASVTISNAVPGQEAHILVLDAKGNQLSNQKMKLIAGINNIELTLLPTWQSGSYIVSVYMDDGVVNKKLIIRR